MVGPAGREPALPECRRMFTNLTNLTNFLCLEVKVGLHVHPKFGHCAEILGGARQEVSAGRSYRWDGDCIDQKMVPDVLCADGVISFFNQPTRASIAGSFLESGSKAAQYAAFCELKEADKGLTSRPVRICSRTRRPRPMATP